MVRKNLNQKINRRLRLLARREQDYRAFDGVGDFEIPLGQQHGRPALSAEDLLDLALDTELFEPVGLFGVVGC